MSCVLHWGVAGFWMNFVDEFQNASKFNEFSTVNYNIPQLPEAEVMRYSIMEKHNKLETQNPL
jgi:hypothetical protein